LCTTGGFAIGAWVSLLRQHSAERKMSASACTRSMPGCLLEITENENQWGQRVNPDLSTKWPLKQGVHAC